MVQLSPMNSWKSISPLVVRALKLGAKDSVRLTRDQLFTRVLRLVGMLFHTYQSIPDAGVAVPGELRRRTGGKQVGPVAAEQRALPKGQPWGQL